MCLWLPALRTGLLREALVAGTVTLDEIEATLG